MTVSCLLLFCYHCMVAGLFPAFSPFFILFHFILFYITTPTTDGAVTTCSAQMAERGPRHHSHKPVPLTIYPRIDNGSW